MTANAHNDFNAWLDAALGGTSTPPSPVRADPDLRDAQRAASKIHDLARQAERPPADPSLPASWESFMSTHNIAAPAQSPAFTGTSPRYSPLPTGARQHGRESPQPVRLPIRWNALANVALAAVLILAIGAGAWRATGGFGFGSWGGSEDPTSIPFGAFIQDDGTPDPGAVDPAILPTAEDCTIEPLTVDEVLFYIQEPYAASRSVAPDATPLAGFPHPDPATPPATNVPAGPASQADLDAMVETQRMWMACVLADSPFQVWALEDPGSLGRLLQAAFPPLTGEDEARTLLEAFQDGTYTAEHPSRSLDNPLGSTCGDMVLISSVPEDSYGVVMTAAVPEGTESRYGRVTVRYTFYDDDGNPTIIGNEPTNLETAYNEERGFIFRWHDARQMWLVETFPNCG